MPYYVLRENPAFQICALNSVYMFIVSFYGQNYIEQDSKTHYAENMSARQLRAVLNYASLA